RSELRTGRETYEEVICSISSYSASRGTRVGLRQNECLPSQSHFASTLKPAFLHPKTVVFASCRPVSRGQISSRSGVVDVSTQILILIIVSLGSLLFAGNPQLKEQGDMT